MIQKIGIWGCISLGLVGLVVPFMQSGLDDPLRFAGGASLILIGVSFWLFKKNAEEQGDDNG